MSKRECFAHARRSMEKIWVQREKQIQRVITNTAQMYEDMQGIIGASLPEIEEFSMPQIAALVE